MTKIQIPYWNKLTMLGVLPSQPYGLQKRIILANKLSLTAMIGLFCMVCIASVLLKRIEPFVVHIPISLTFGLVMWLNYRGKNQTARFIGSLAIPVLVTIVSVVLKLQLEEQREITFYFAPRLVIFSSIAFSFIMIRPNEVRMRFVITALTMIILLAFNPIHEYFDVGVGRLGIQLNYYYIIDVILFFALLLLGSGIYFLLDINKVYENKLNTALEDSKDSNYQLQQANEELGASEEELRQQAEALMQTNSSLQAAQAHIEKLLSNSLKTNKELQKTQKKLGQAEKMASLGQLTAGIAHEINNPMNFISGGIQTLKSIVEDYQGLIAQYQLLEQEDKEKWTSLLQEVQSYKSTIDFELEESQSDVKLLIETIESGIDRTTAIVKGLQYFSNTNTHAKAPADIHGAIQQALRKLLPQYESRIEIKLNLSLEPAIIHCFIGQIEELFMVIIGNAVEAIPELGYINIHTKMIEEQLIITVEDSGIGMDADTQAQVFNPFFSMKAIGNVGLGLAIAYGIIQNHGGSILVESELGKGSAFTISLPIK